MDGAPARTYPLKPCQQCGTLILRWVPPNVYRRLKFCCHACSSLARQGTANPHQPGRKQGRNGRALHDLPPDPPALFHIGLPPETRTCPRTSAFCSNACGGLLTREPAFLHCRMCGTLWPIRGADYRSQMVYELAAATVHNHGGTLIRKGAPGVVGSVE